jgi:hypothetical protein
MRSAPAPVVQQRGFNLRPDVPTPNRGEPARPNVGVNRGNGTGAQEGNANYVRGGRRYIGNPVYRGPVWGWNHGVAFVPHHGYYGGGFWGAYPIGVGVYFGSLFEGGQTYDSYEVDEESPGAMLLSNYHLQQTPCGPPDLVVIYGPDNSIICAYPNDIVDAGEYTLDPATLTIVSM